LVIQYFVFRVGFTEADNAKFILLRGDNVRVKAIQQHQDAQAKFATFVSPPP